MPQSNLHNPCKVWNLPSRICVPSHVFTKGSPHWFLTQYYVPSHIMLLVVSPHIHLGRLPINLNSLLLRTPTRESLNPIGATS
jgi:hypothetical protein